MVKSRTRVCENVRKAWVCDMTSIRPQCFECARVIYRKDGAFIEHCEAFPLDGPLIPSEILDNEFSHTQSYPGDHGLQFLQKEKPL